MALAFARGVGEYGSVIFIAGNLIGMTEIAPLLIIEKLEEFDYAGATAIAAIMLAHLVRDAARDQPPAGLRPDTARRCLTRRFKRPTPLAAARSRASSASR